MKVYIHTDIEGVAGYVFYANFQSSSLAVWHHNQRMNRLLTDEVKAAAQAALDSGAGEVLVNDSHGCCYNVIFEELPPRCQIIHGRPGFFDGWLACFDEEVDALVCVGQHAMAGTPHAVCPHSLWHVNGGKIALSEATMAAALAGERGVPCVCVSGDDKVCAEVAQKIPEAETVAVKCGISAQNARSLVPEAACRLIYERVRRGLERRDRIPPFCIPGPYRLNISDRNPKEKMLPHDMEGASLWETAHRAMNQTPFGHYGEDPIDDRSWRWPS